MKLYFQKYFELSFWVVALTTLACMDPKTGGHYSLCLFHQLGFTFCPGCGLAHSISFLFRGMLSQSFHAHFFGIPALLIILHRIITLTIPLVHPTKKIINGKF